jgi:ABC-type glycerol-3-phosphate transport system permease component
MVMPLIWIVLTAFKERNEIFSLVPQWLPAHPTLNNFLGVLDAMPFWRYYWTPWLWPSGFWWCSS